MRAGAAVTVESGFEEVPGRAAQVPAGDQRQMEAWARDHHVGPGLVDPIRLPPVIRGDDDIDVGAKGLQLGGQEPAVEPRCADLEHHGPRVGEEAGERDLEPRVAGEEDPLAPDAVTQSTEILPGGPGPHGLAGPGSGLLGHVLHKAGRSVYADGHEGPYHRGPASLGDRGRRFEVRVHHGHDRSLPERRKVLDSGLRHGPCHLYPGPKEFSGEPLRSTRREGATEQHHGAAVTRVLRFAASSEKSAEEAAALGRRGGLYEVRGPPLGAEVHQGGYDAVLEVG